MSFDSRGEGIDRFYVNDEINNMNQHLVSHSMNDYRKNYRHKFLGQKRIGCHMTDQKKLFIQYIIIFIS